MGINLFNSITHITEQHLHRLRQQNPILRKLRYPHLHGWLVNASGQPLRHTSELFFLSLLLAILSHLTNPALGLPFREEFTEIKTFHSNLLNTQATLAALTYPIVIGFVGLILQGRRSAKARMQIYLTDSGALLVGLSSLFLILSMSLQSRFIVLATPNVRELWIWMDLAWFLANVTGTIWFLFRTIEFIRPDQQARVVLRYAVDVAWPNTLRLLLKFRLFWGVQQYNYLPGSLEEEWRESGNPQVLLHPLWRDTGEPEVFTSLSRPHILEDVKLRPLNWILTRWSMRSSVLPSRPRTSGPAPQRPKIILPLSPGEVYEGKVVLCRRDGGDPFAWWERWVLRWCFSFKRQSGTSKLVPIDLIFEDIQGDILTAVDQRQIKAFKDGIDLANDLLATLIESGAFQDSTGKFDNYTNLEDFPSFFGSRVYENWLQIYREVFARAALLIHEDDEYFRIASYRACHLFSATRETATTPILIKIIHLPGALLHQLALWWTRRVEEQGTVTHDACNGAVLKPPYSSVYEDALRSFVGAWESLEQRFHQNDRTKAASWEQLKLQAPWFEAHLERTTLMLSANVARGDTAGSLWITDILQKWLNAQHLEPSLVDRYSSFLTLEALNHEREHILANLNIEPFLLRHENISSNIFAALLRNYWADACCILIYLLLSWGRLSSIPEPLCLRVTKALLDGEILKAGEDTRRIKPVSSFGDLLTSWLRQYFGGAGDSKGYRVRLDKLMQNLQRVQEQEWVSGRIYSGWGRQNLDSLLDSQIALLCCMAKSAWTPPQRLTHDLRRLASGNDEIARDMITHLESIEMRLPEITFSEWGPSFSHLRGETANAESFETAKQHVRSAAHTLVQFLQGLHDERLRNASPSPTRLRKVAESASSQAFSKESGRIPVALFQTIDSSAETFEERRLRIPNFEKGELTDPLMAPLPVNQDEWFVETTKDYVAAVVMSDLLAPSELASVDASTPERYWNELKRASERILQQGLHPVLLVGKQTRPSWIWDWRWPSGEDSDNQPDDLQIRMQQDIAVPGYIAHFNQIAVYQAPLESGASLVMPHEMFRRLVFTRFENGFHIEAYCEPTDDFSLVDLILKWSHKIELGPYSIIRLEYPNEE